MKNLLHIKKCLISVSNKKKIVTLAKSLSAAGSEIISTGNTYKTLINNEITSKKIEELTKFKEILDGRVKTLHPKVFAGILADLENKSHIKQIKSLNIDKIQLLVVNLYPFEETIKVSKVIKECIENIDIGGPSLIRAAAKNFFSTAVIVDTRDYKRLIEELRKYNGITLEFRKYLALKAFKRTMSYDLEIYKWFEKKILQKKESHFFLSGKKIEDLRYGENPHQSASVYSFNTDKVENFYTKLNGKDLSYNNLNDVRAALSLLAEFDLPASVIIKHAIPCGVSEKENILFSWKKAYSADKLSAFGGVVGFNRTVKKELALDLNKIFLEVIAAKNFSESALEILKQKKNLRIIKIKNLKDFKVNKPKAIITMPNIFLVQDNDNHFTKKRNLKIVSFKKPSKKEIEDLIFANKVVKHVRSNAIVIAKNKITLGIGSGNTSRVDSVNFAIQKSSRSEIATKKNYLKGAVMASDAFFPFADSILLASKVGIKSIIQPGGSIKDKEIIEEINKKKMSMIFTNKRSFTH